MFKKATFEQTNLGRHCLLLFYHTSFSWTFNSWLWHRALSLYWTQPNEKYAFMSLFLKQTDLTKWKRFPQHPQTQTRHQWYTSDLRPRLSGLWQPFCSFCVSQRIQPDSSSTPLYFTLNSKSGNMPVVLPASLLSVSQSQLQRSGEGQMCVGDGNE